VNARNTRAGVYRTKQSERPRAVSEEKSRPTHEQFAAYSKMYAYFNRELFGGELPEIILNFSRHGGSYGFFAPERWARDSATTHEISINPAHLAERPPQATASTLVHEMVHLWQMEYGYPPRRGYHDREWAMKMRSVGLIPIDPHTGVEKMSAQALTHKIAEEGPFAAAFERMPREYLLPWTCSEARALTSGRKAKRGAAGGENGGEGAGAAPKSRNKVKYTCPGCCANVWGRPGLAIICGACSTHFV